MRSLYALGDAREIFEHLYARNHINNRCLRNRLTGIKCLKGGKLIIALAQYRRGSAQDLSSLGSWHCRPLGKTTAGRLHRQGNLGIAGNLNVTDSPAGPRVVRRETGSIAVGQRPAINEI